MPPSSLTFPTLSLQTEMIGVADNHSCGMSPRKRVRVSVRRVAAFMHVCLCKGSQRRGRRPDAPPSSATPTTALCFGSDQTFFLNLCHETLD